MSQPPKKPPFSSAFTTKKQTVPTASTEQSTTETGSSSGTSSKALNQTKATTTSSQDGQQSKANEPSNHTQLAVNTSATLAKQQTTEASSLGQTAAKVSNFPPSPNEGSQDGHQTKPSEVAKKAQSTDGQTQISSKSSSILPQPSQAAKSNGRASLIGGMPQRNNSSNLLTESVNWLPSLFASQLRSPVAPEAVRPQYMHPLSNGTRFPIVQGKVPSSRMAPVNEDSERQYWLQQVMPRVLDYLEANPDVDQALGLVIDRVCQSFVAQSPPSSTAAHGNVSIGSGRQLSSSSPLNQQGNSATRLSAPSSGQINSRRDMAMLNNQTGQQDRPLSIDTEEGLPAGHDQVQVSPQSAKQVNSGSSTKPT